MISKMAATMAENMAFKDSEKQKECKADQKPKEVRCEMCGGGDVKYRCPGCGIRTCCLACVKQHKASSSCDGKRNKTGYVSMQEFHEGHLLSDYHFLEEVGRKSDSATRDPMRYYRQASKHVNAMVNQARRKNIAVRILPYTFSRRRKNTTIFHYRSKQLQWLIDWYFPDEDLLCSSSRVVGYMTLKAALECLLQPGPGGDASQAATAYRLRHFRQQPLMFLMQDQQGSKPRYHKLDGSSCIDDNLAGKEIVEYPTITVIFEKKKRNYSIISNGEESSGSEDSESDSSDSSSGSSDDSDEKTKTSDDTSNHDNQARSVPSDNHGDSTAQDGSHGDSTGYCSHGDSGDITGQEANIQTGQTSPAETVTASNISNS